MNTFCKKIEDHTPEAYIVDEDMSVLLKCTKCNWSHFQSFSQAQLSEIDFNKD